MLLKILLDKKKVPTDKLKVLLVSGHQDLNLGPPAPKAGALPGCATPRKSGGGGGIRTLGTVTSTSV